MRRRYVTTSWCDLEEPDPDEPRAGSITVIEDDGMPRPIGVLDRHGRMFCEMPNPIGFTATTQKG